MATSTLTFQLSGLAQSTTEQTFSVQVDPPSNIRGKLCYVECTFFGWDHYTALSPSLNAKDVFYLTCNWAQPLSSTNTNGKTLPGCALAAFNNNFYTGAGPVLCRIPDGPHEVTFVVKRWDGGEVSDDLTNTNYALIFLKVVPANSRSPPIGV
jgi:hypothetical protein